MFYPLNYRQSNFSFLKFLLLMLHTQQLGAIGVQFQQQLSFYSTTLVPEAGWVT
jgi:hypothetical protein